MRFARLFFSSAFMLASGAERSRTNISIDKGMLQPTFSSRLAPSCEGLWDVTVGAVCVG